MEERNCPRCHRRVLAVGPICPECRLHFTDHNYVPTLVQDGFGQNGPFAFHFSVYQWNHARLLFREAGYIVLEEKLESVESGESANWRVTAIPGHDQRALWPCRSVGPRLFDTGARIFRFMLYCDPSLRRLFQKDPFPEISMRMENIPPTPKDRPNARLSIALRRHFFRTLDRYSGP